MLLFCHNGEVLYATNNVDVMTVHLFQCAVNFVMFGEITEEGLVSKGSSDYVMLVHKDSTAISKSEHPNFQLEMSR